MREQVAAVSARAGPFLPPAVLFAANARHVSNHDQTSAVQATFQPYCKLEFGHEFEFALELAMASILRREASEFRSTKPKQDDPFPPADYDGWEAYTAWNYPSGITLLNGNFFVPDNTVRKFKHRS
jgi:hypothetical protein